MGKKNKKFTKAGGRSSKASLSKLSNKHLNKLAKQGKLKKKLGKQKYVEFLKERTSTQSATEIAQEKAALGERIKEEEDDIPLEEADYEFFATPGRDLSFLTEVEEIDEKRKRRKRKATNDAEDDGLESKYEGKSKRVVGDEKQMKALLPIKGKTGVIPQMEEIEEASDEDEEADETVPAEETPAAEPLPALSTAQLFANREQRLYEHKIRLAVASSNIIENPEENYGKLKELRLLLELQDPDLQVTLKKITMVSLMEIFKDIIPEYRIRVATEAEKQQSAKKETKKLRDFEEGLLNNFRHYLEFMECVVKGKPPKTKNKKLKTRSLVEIPPRAMQGLREVALRCMCELLLAKPHFNFRTNIISVIAPFTDSSHNEVSDMVCEYVERIFKEDREGEVTLELVRLIGRIIKAKKFEVKPRVLKTFLSLKIKEIQKEADKEDNKAARREKIRKMSKRDRKRHKQMKDLEKELQDAAMGDNRERKLKVHTEIISVVFLTYFRILKQAQESELLGPVLEGLAKFAHLINIEFFDDLFSVLNQLIDSGGLSYREALHCTQTAFAMLSGQGTALNIDPHNFYKHLYSSLFSLHVGRTTDDMPLVLDSIFMMIIKRHKQVSFPRVLAFLKRLTTLCLQLGSDGILGAMATIRSIMHSQPKSDIILDPESETRGVYFPELEDPEHCNATYSVLWELPLLSHHYHPVVRKYARHLAVGAPSQGQGQLPAELAHRNGVELYRTYDTSQMEFTPNLQKPGKHKNSIPAQSFTAERLTDECDHLLTIDSTKLHELDFSCSHTFNRTYKPKPKTVKKKHAKQKGSMREESSAGKLNTVTTKLKNISNKIHDRQRTVAQPLKKGNLQKKKKSNRSVIINGLMNGSG